MQLDVDAIYAQPTDVHRVYHQVAGDHELSQTESQMGSDRSRVSPSNSEQDSNGHIYSSPNKSKKRYINSEIIMEGGGQGSEAPALPERPHRQSTPSVSSLGQGSEDQFIARAQGGVLSAAMMEADDNRMDALDSQTPRSVRTIGSVDRDAALAALEEAYADEEGASATTTPRQLSSRELVDSVYHVGIPISASMGPGEAHGSVKSHHSTYRYSYYTEPTEPLPGEREIEYNIMKSVH